MHESVLDLINCYEKRIQLLKKERDELLPQSLKTLTDVSMKSKSYLTEQEVEATPTVMTSKRISPEECLLNLNNEKDDKLIVRESKVSLDYEYSEPDLAAETTDKHQTNEQHGLDVVSLSHKHTRHSTGSNIINQMPPQESDSTNVLTVEEPYIVPSIKMLQPMDGTQLLDLPDGQIVNEQVFPPLDCVCIEPDLAEDRTMKVLVLGGVAGKTCYCIRITKNFFSSDCCVTIGVDAFEYKTRRKQCTVEVLLWDVPFTIISSISHYSRGTNGVIVICNITRKDTLLEAKECKKQFDQYIDAVPSLLLVNQIDRPSEYHELTQSDIDEVVKECNFDAVFEISCKKNINCKESIESLVDLILQPSIKPSQPPSIMLEPAPVTNKQNCFLM